MAQVLDEFEKEIEPRIPKAQAQTFKALVRRKIDAFTVDVIEVMKLAPDQEINAHAQSVKDSLHPDAAVTPGGPSA
jgi:hypothetical protein